MADPGEGLGPPATPPYFRPKWVPKGWKKFFWVPPPLISGSGWPSLPHLKVSIRHCLPTCLPTCSSTPWHDYMLTYMGTGVFTICTNQSGGNLVHYCKVYKIWLPTQADVSTYQWRIQGRGWVPRPPPLILDPNESRRAEKNFFESPPPLSQGLDDRPSPIWRSQFATAYLRVYQPVHPPPDMITCLPTWGLGCLPFAQTNQVEILCIIVKSIKYDLVGDQRATRYMKISLTDQKE